MHRSHHYKRNFLSACLSAIVLLLVARIGWSPLSLAATFNHNPHSVINSCSLSAGKTVIYGWGHDPDAPKGGNPTVTVTVGTQLATVKTSIDGYHETAINKYLKANWPDAPTSGTYGFTASFANLYKGTVYGISGLVHNYGDGNDTSAKVDTTTISYDGISPATKLNSNNTLPDACLNAKPAPPPPPTPTPTPPPTPTPTHSGSTGTTHTTTPVSTTPTTPADASVSAGTLTALLTVPADTATSISIAYGTSSGVFDYLTDPLAPTGGTALISLVDLTPKTDYFYQILRTDAGGKTTTSAEAKFTTAGYAASLRFIDAHGKPVSGVSGAIDDTHSTSAKSDKNGTMTFSGLDDGQYTVTFHYGKLNYTRQFNTETAGDGSDNPSKVITLKDVVNVSKLTGGTTAGYAGPVHHSKWPLILFIIAFIGIAAGVVFWLRRRGRTGSGFLPPHGDYALATLPSVSSPIPPIKPPKKTKHSKKEPAEPHLEHVGESLRDMVLKSMHEEAQKRKANKPQ